MVAHEQPLRQPPEVFAWFWGLVMVHHEQPSALVTVHHDEVPASVSIGYENDELRMNNRVQLGTVAHRQHDEFGYDSS